MNNLDYLYSTIHKNDSLRLIDIKENKNCWFQCLHSYSIFYKTPDQIINNHFIIDKLASLDASMIGIVCGEVYNEFINKRKKLQKPFTLKSNLNQNYYSLLFINRDSSITYETTFYEKRCEKSILDLIKKKELIKLFAPSDAYYLGFLAGLELWKIKNNLRSKNVIKKPYLRIVK